MIRVETRDEIHEELMAQLPGWFKPRLEYIAIMRGWSAVLSGITEDADKIYKNMFVQTADSDTLRRWERVLGIIYDPAADDDYRRQMIMSKLRQIAPFTIWHLQDKLTEYFGDDYELEVDTITDTIKIFVTSDRYGAVNLLYDLIWSYVPAHLAVYANQQVSVYVPGRLLLGARTMHTIEQTIGG